MWNGYCPSSPAIALGSCVAWHLSNSCCTACIPAPHCEPPVSHDPRMLIKQVG